MTLLPDSTEDKSRLLELFVGRLQSINKKSGTILGTYQILEMLEEMAIEEGMIECPHCHRRGEC